MTWPWPSGKLNGWPRFHEASNSLPVDHESPTYWTVASWPGLTAGPLPTTRSFLTSDVGGVPRGLAIFGLLVRSLALATAGAAPAAAGGAAVVAAAAGAVAEFVPVFEEEL